MQITMEQLSKIFISVENEIGTTKLTLLSLDAINSAARFLKVKDVGDFMKKYEELVMNIRNTKPRMAIIIYYFSITLECLIENKDSFKTLEDVYSFLEKKTIEISKEIEADLLQVQKIGSSLVQDNDVILIHDHSSTILGTIVEAKKAGKKFSVIVWEQKQDTTEKIIYFLQQNNIDLQVIPEYMLSHIEHKITKFFVWGLSFNNEFNFVGAPGTNEIVSEFFHAKKEIYMFMTTKKYSLWVSEEASDYRYKIKEVTGLVDPKVKPYQRLKFSHDRIPIDLFTGLVTEQWILTPQETKDEYTKLYAQSEIWRDTYFSKK